MHVGFIGTGLMGLPMAQKLVESKIDLVTYNRTLEKPEPPQNEGLRIAQQPIEAINSGDCIILMLTSIPIFPPNTYLKMRSYLSTNFKGKG